MPDRSATAAESTGPARATPPGTGPTSPGTGPAAAVDGPAVPPHLRSDRFCSASALAAGEPLAGTAPARRSWVLVEHPGPWGRDPLADAPWPDQLGIELARQVAASGVRLLAVRRHDARPVDGPPERPYVALSWTGPGGWAACRQLDSPADLLTLPLAETAAGLRPDPARWPDAGPLWGVCTHGTRDACCARSGRALADALTGADPDHVWEISHSGGHRFAPVLMSWPEGLSYGRVPPDRALELIDARHRGHLVPDLLRGQVHLSEPEQAADIALRTALHLTALDEVRRIEVRDAPADAANHPGPGLVRTWWEAAGRAWRVDVHRAPLPDRPASCGKDPEPASAWRCSDPVPARR